MKGVSVIRTISAKTAGTMLLAGLFLLAAFHVLVLLGVAPSEIVWGGRGGGSDADLIAMEGTALGVTLLFALIVIVKQEYVLRGRFRTSARVGMWAIGVFFALNTVGNLASGVTAENYVFAPIAFLLSLLAFRLAIERKSATEKG